MAIEDAYILSEALALTYPASKNPTTESVEAAFQAYNDVRIERTQRLVRASHDAGECYELHGQGVGDAFEAFTKNMQTRYDWVWDEDLEQEAKTCKEIFRKLTEAF
jgi:salicylate hydroxylase